MSQIFQAVRNRDVEKLKSLLQEKNNQEELAGALINAAELGYLDIVKCFVAAGVWDEWAVVPASSFGRADVVRYLVRKGPCCLDAALIGAAAHGQEKTVRFLTGKGAGCLDEALTDAERRGYDGIVKYLSGKGARRTKETEADLPGISR